MIFPQNLHTHTVYSDGKHTPGEMAAGAVRSGCASLGFSEHSPLTGEADPDGWSMKPASVPAYREDILRLRTDYAGRLTVFLGLEQDIDSAPPTDPYDYLIGSVHGVWADGAYLSVDAGPELFDRAVREHFGGDCYAFARAYYRREAEAAAKTGCRIVGHFDLIAKFNEGGCRFDETDPRYRSAALEALDALMERDVIFEVNTGAMSRGWRTAPYPHPALLRAVQERRGRICITSDSHHAETVVHAFPQAAEHAMACGFRESWILTESGWKAAPLDQYLTK